MSLDGWVTGLSNHAKERLSTRFGVKTLDDQKAFASLVLGIENRDWFRSDSPQVDPARGEGAHGRVVRWSGEEILCVVVSSLTGGFLVTTVLDNLFVSDSPLTGQPTYQELMDEVERLSKELAQAQEACEMLSEDLDASKEKASAFEKSLHASQIELNLANNDLRRALPLVSAVEVLRTFFQEEKR